MTISQLLSLFSQDVDPGIRALSSSISCCVPRSTKKNVSQRLGLDRRKQANPVGAGRATKISLAFPPPTYLVLNETTFCAI